MATSGPPAQVKPLRDTAAIAFFGFLVGLAYQEAVGPAGKALQDGPSVTDVAMFVAFFLLGLTTFLFGSYFLAAGAQAGAWWLVNFALVVLEGVILIFMADVASAEASRTARIGFGDFLWVYLVVDALWNWVTACTGRASDVPFVIPFALISSVGAFLAIVSQVAFSGDDAALAASIVLVAVFAVQMIVLVKKQLV